MSNIVYPKYAIGDTIEINPEGVGQVYSTYKEFFTLYGINSSNYKPDNDICLYLDRTFTILCIAPHQTEQIPLYVITDECSGVTFLVNEKAILEVTGKKDFYINPYYGMINNMTEQYDNLKRELFDAYRQIEYLKSKSNIESMPELAAGMLGKVFYPDEDCFDYFVVTVSDHGLIMVCEHGDYDDIDSFDEFGKAYIGDSISAEIATLYTPRIKSFILAKTVDEEGLAKDVLWMM